MSNWKKWLICSVLIIGSIFAFEATAYAQSQGRLTGDNVRVRLTPNLATDDNILFLVNRGEVVEILEVAGDFYRVNVRDYSEVYIFRDFVHEIDEEYELLAELYAQFASYNANIIIDELISYAKGYLGTPYRWGGTDPSRGFDCSGFVFVVMRNFGINLNRSSRDMAANNGFRVDRNAMQAGDLVFFATGGGGRVSHVGIYIGGDRFIHSATRGGVMISGMGETYWRTRFVRANRVL